MKTIGEELRVIYRFNFCLFQTFRVYLFSFLFALVYKETRGSGSFSLSRSLRSPVLGRFVLAQGIIEFLQLLPNDDNGTNLPRSEENMMGDLLNAPKLLGDSGDLYHFASTRRIQPSALFRGLDNVPRPHLLKGKRRVSNVNPLWIVLASDLEAVLGKDGSYT